MPYFYVLTFLATSRSAKKMSPELIFIFTYNSSSNKTL
jgi:hypothetical protein